MKGKGVIINKELRGVIQKEHSIFLLDIVFALSTSDQHRHNLCTIHILILHLYFHIQVPNNNLLNYL